MAEPISLTVHSFSRTGRSVQTDGRTSRDLGRTDIFRVNESRSWSELLVGRSADHLSTGKRTSAQELRYKFRKI